MIAASSPEFLREADYNSWINSSDSWISSLSAGSEKKSHACWTCSCGGGVVGGGGESKGRGASKGHGSGGSVGEGKSVRSPIPVATLKYISNVLLKTHYAHIFDVFLSLTEL